jgi:ParB family transcriptional regulator, chromosome partitioning protein
MERGPDRPLEAKRKPRLGKGLSALLGDYMPSEEGSPQGPVRSVQLSRVVANPFQPRREFDSEQLAELTASIRENGLLQPLIVRPHPSGEGWELVAGERRIRALRALGWGEAPAVIRTLDDRAMLLLAIVENVQRAELSPLEEARGYRRLVDEFGLTQQEVAENVGRERSTVANLLRLLHLPASVQRLIEEGAISMGHARALLGAGSEQRITLLARETVSRGLSVREVERRVREDRDRPDAPPQSREARADPHLKRVEVDLRRALGTKVRIRVHPGKADRGRIEIPFLGAEDFERLLEILLGSDAARGY